MSWYVLTLQFHIICSLYYSISINTTEADPPPPSNSLHNGIEKTRCNVNYTRPGSKLNIYFFICARLELFCDFLQFDWLHERAAFHDILPLGALDMDS